MERALGALPADVPGDLKLDRHQALVNRLNNAPLTQPNSITERLIDAETEKILAPWRHQRVIDKAVETTCMRLPYDLRYSECYVVLQNQAAESARKAIEKIGAVPSWQLEAAGAAAVAPMIATFEQEQSCAKIVAGFFFSDSRPTSTLKLASG
jgi:hypothetical protein